jgi:hypothetical protein
MRKGCLGGLICGRVIGEILTHLKTILQRRQKVARTHAEREKETRSVR